MYQISVFKSQGFAHYASLDSFLGLGTDLEVSCNCIWIVSSFLQSVYKNDIFSVSVAIIYHGRKLYVCVNEDFEIIFC